MIVSASCGTTSHTTRSTTSRERASTASTCAGDRPRSPSFPARCPLTAAATGAAAAGAGACWTDGEVSGTARPGTAVGGVCAGTREAGAGACTTGMPEGAVREMGDSRGGAPGTTAGGGGDAAGGAVGPPSKLSVCVRCVPNPGRDAAVGGAGGGRGADENGDTAVGDGV